MILTILSIEIKARLNSVSHYAQQSDIILIVNTLNKEKKYMWEESSRKAFICIVFLNVRFKGFPSICIIHKMRKRKSMRELTK